MERRELILDTADPVFVVDRELRIVLWNRGAEALLGFQAHEIRGKGRDEVLGCREASGRRVCHENCMETVGRLQQELVTTHDLKVRTKTGPRTWVSISTILIPSRRRDLSLLLHLLRDASRQKEMDRLIEQLQVQVLKLFSAARTDPPVTPSPSPPPMDLTNREREVLRLLFSGASTQAIAKNLGISPATAQNHIRHLLPKLGAHSRLEAVTLALRNGMI